MTHMRLVDHLDMDGIEDGLNCFEGLVRYHSGQSASELEANILLAALRDSNSRGRGEV
jgi:hypothetical protein